MKKNTLCSLAFLSLLLISGVSSFAADKYYCGTGGSYSHENILDNSSNCETWNTDFWRRQSPGNYKECLDNKQRLNNLYSQGRCEKMVVKSFSYGGRDCVFEIIESQKRIVSSMCTSTVPNAAGSDEVQKIFKQKYGY